MKRIVKRRFSMAGTIGFFTLIAVGSGAEALAGELTIPNTFMAGETALASEVNENFTAIKTEMDDNVSGINTNSANIASKVDRAGDTMTGDLIVNGNVGIGTTSPPTSPQGKLNIAAADIRTALIIDTYAEFEASSSEIWFRRSNTDTLGTKTETIDGNRLGEIVFWGVDNSSEFGVGAIIEARQNGASGADRVPGDLYLYTYDIPNQPNIDQMVLHHTGNIGIGTASPTFPLEMASGAHVTTGGVWTNASSREYKDDITGLELQEALKTLQGLEPVKYKYKGTEDERHVGFIAEDVPDLVATKDRKGLSPMDIVAVLAKVVQQQQKEIEELKSRLTTH